ncbi:MAG TPA: cation-translocating P-type ATPase [Sphingobacteriaceae bacterium]|nr:cation-translocating P-type ATPase [Sphingobacteriaceae bacterium]
MSSRPWHAWPAGDVLAYWEVDPAAGLPAHEARRRQETFGANVFEEEARQPRWRLLLNQFRDVMVLVLLAAALMAALLGETADALTIGAIIILNASMGFLYEYRAEQALLALRRLTAPTARVLREGVVASVAAKDLVPGDLLLLETGDRIPADARLYQADSLEVDEAALTGESLPVAKDPAVVLAEEAVVGDRANMVHQGCAVVRGRGRAVVVATGMATEMGRIAGLINRAGPEETPLQRRLAELGRYLVIGCLAACLLVVFIGLWNGETLYTMVLAGVSLAVAAIPEGLPAVVTIVLALGVHRLVKVKAVIRRLPAVETLGSTTAICSDKTGTLTLGQMRVRSVWAEGRLEEPGPAASPAVKSLLAVAGALCNNAEPAPGGGARGTPTETALYLALLEAGLDPGKFRMEQPLWAEFPFDSYRKRMTVVRRRDGRLTAYVKGAPEGLLPLCTTAVAGEALRPMTPALRQQVGRAVDALAGDGLRVLAVASRSLGPVPGGEAGNPGPSRRAQAAADDLERDLTFHGLVALADPPRPEAAQALRRCRAAGIRVYMVTGDHRRTAEAVAGELGLTRQGGGVLEGWQVQQLDDRGLAAAVAGTDVFARVSPEHKLRIVQALKARGHVVAMTGDGINDAPAVKEAHIGIAMGRTGTDVTKEAAGMVLLDDNFATIVNAVEQGRAIYENIRRFVRYLLASNLGEVFVMFLGTLLGLPLPLLPIHILFVNLVTDGLPAVALGLEPPDPGVMERPPRAPGESLFSDGMGRRIIAWGVAIGITALAVFLWCLWDTGSLAQARTAAFASLVVSQMFHVLDCRSRPEPDRFRGRDEPRGRGGRNPALWGAVASSLVLLALVVHWPPLQGPFRAEALTWVQWSGVLAAGGLWPLLLAAARAVRCKAKSIPVG